MDEVLVIGCKEINHNSLSFVKKEGVLSKLWY